MPDANVRHASWRSCAAGVRPAWPGGDGSQEPPCDPHATRPIERGSRVASAAPAASFKRRSDDRRPTGKRNATRKDQSAAPSSPMIVWIRSSRCFNPTCSCSTESRLRFLSVSWPFLAYCAMKSGLREAMSAVARFRGNIFGGVLSRAGAWLGCFRFTDAVALASARSLTHISLL